MDNAILTIPERIEQLRKDRHLTLEQLEQQTGLSKSALGNYESNDGKDISHYAIIKLAQFYGVTSDYLLGLSDIENHPHAELHELHLSDKMMELLKSGKINNRLLCEFAEHENFQRFMLDFEIYVDRIASMHIHDLNVLLAGQRKILMDRKDLDAKELRMFELEKVEEDDYFAHTIFEDLRPIMRDIREVHRNDITTADVTSPAAESLQHIKEALSYEGSPEEKKAKALLSQFSIDYNAITKEEFVTFIEILRKSKHMKSYDSRRGKAHPPKKRKKKK